ncbi:MAG: hypothetical protein ACJAT2_000493 [Bacteriovoracaceae bacterium]|jgi:hypothetical protein
MKILFLLVILFQLQAIARADVLQSFKSDGCSMYPDGLPLVEENKWVHCCVTHDMAYWVGGKKEEKLKADALLGQCVAEQTSELHGNLMELGVLAGGLPNSGLPWRWGYGFENGRSYKTMTLEEKKMHFEKFDGIIYEIERLSPDLTLDQVSYMLARFEFQRHLLAVDLKLPSEVEMQSYDKRLEIVYKIYNRDSVLFPED